MKKALLWKLLERFGVQGTQFVLQIVLARLLSPDHYGILTIMIVFTSLANVFIQTGFNTALIQNKDVTDEDYSSVLWITLGIAGILYAIIFFCAPLIASFYDMPILIWPLRVLAIMLFPGALNSIQLAKVSREMDFKKVFFSNIGGIIISGAVGIVIALMGGGLWALVAQTMLNIFVAAIVMALTSGLKIKFVINLKRVKTLFSYGWKLLVSGLVDTLYQDLQALVVGKKYSESTLGYFNRGKQFPQFLINSINGTVQSVMLPAMSEKQNNPEELKTLTRTAITLSSYIVFPLMAGLAAVAEPLVLLLLTEKWLPAVPYLQIYCFSFAFYPVHSCNLQAINAIGRSDLFLKLEIIKKSYGLIALIIALAFFESPIAIASTGLVTAFLSCFVNALPNKKLINYSYFEQLHDMLPSFLLSAFMFICVLAIKLLNLNPVLTLCIQVVAGVVIYIAGSALLKIKPYLLTTNLIKNAIDKTKPD